MGGRTPAERTLGPRAEAAGLYGPGSEAWHLNREAALLLGAGPRALLLQVAHPLVAEGVDQHSSFRVDPWSRLAGTLGSYLRIVYGSGPVAHGEIRRLNALHRPIAGPVHDPAAAARFGGAYAARDPALSLWVHATLVESTLAVSDAWLGPVARARRARLYAETLPIGRALGVPAELLPPDLEAFEAYVARMLGPEGPVHPSALSRELAGAILRPSLALLVRMPALATRLGGATDPIAGILGRVPPVAYGWLLLPAIGLLPAGTRAEYGLAWRRRERAVAAWLVTGWMAWRPLIPPRLRWFPQALAADARVAAARTARSGNT